MAAHKKAPKRRKPIHTISFEEASLVALWRLAQRASYDGADELRESINRRLTPRLLRLVRSGSFGILPEGAASKRLASHKCEVYGAGSWECQVI